MGLTPSETDEVIRDVYEQAGLPRQDDIGIEWRSASTAALSEPQWPDGFTGDGPCARARRERVYEAQMASFADTWMFAREPFEIWVALVPE